MTAYIFSSLASAQACIAPVDADQGYPKVGVNIGGGNHVPGPFVTQTYAAVIAHPTLPQWAYPADAVTTPALTPQAAVLGLPAPTALDATWFPAVAL